MKRPTQWTPVIGEIHALRKEVNSVMYTKVGIHLYLEPTVHRLKLIHCQACARM